ncbi:MAG: hypothetical protein J6A53_06290 [Clostridia bacterium]|nr:hypothetical protein [Clostridia bacterium]MBO5440248.1 hypothetical protein [Clostridia bacterium]
MKETIKALFSGKIYPFENCKLKNNEFLKTRELLSQKREELLEIVENEKLEEYDSLLSELNYYYQEDYFCQGLELGMKLIIEVLA